MQPGAVLPSEGLPRPAGLTPTSVSAHRRLFGLLFGINVLNYADRFTLPAVAPLLAASLHLSDTQLGLLGTAFLLVYAITAPPLGVLADRHSRTRIVGAGVALWSVATALTALCRTFPQVFTVRALLGIGEGSYFPASLSMLADAFPMERRARVLAWWGTATPVGVFLGYAAGGLVGQHFGWPAAFLLVGLPGLVLAILVWASAEPRRGASEGLQPTAGLEGVGLFGIRLLAIRSVAFAIGAQVFAFFVLGGLSFWLTTYLNRQYHLDTGSAGLIAGALFVIGGGIGTLGGGYVADRLLARLPSARLLVPSVGFLLGAVVIALGLLAPTLVLFLVAYTIAGALMSSYSGPLSALFQDVVAPAARARAVALSLLISHVFGDAFSPSLMGQVSDALGGAAGGGLARAMWLAPLAAAVAGLVGLAGCRYVLGDRTAMLARATKDGVA